MEMIDILDESGKETGEIESREIVHNKGLWHKTVHVWIQNQKGEILFQKRSLKKETHPGLWDISCAGHVSAKENCLNAAKREAREELGINLYTEKLKFLFKIRHRWILNYKKSIIKENEISYVYLYTIPLDINEIHPDLNEVDDVRFLSASETKDQLITNKKEYVPHDEEYYRILEFLQI